MINSAITMVIGVAITGRDEDECRVAIRDVISCMNGSCVTFICPCGVSSSVDLEFIRYSDLAHPCGHKDHWTIKYFRPRDFSEKG